MGPSVPEVCGFTALLTWQRQQRLGVVVAVGAKTSMLLVPTTVAEMLVPEMARR